MTVQISTGGFVRHRDRMVQESVIEDLRDVLIACRWMAGTTARPVIDPAAPGDGWKTITTAPSQVMKIAVQQVKVIDFFPELSVGEDDSPRTTETNTLAVDTGVPGESALMELGSDLREQPYVFTMAFYAESDAVALAMFNDLRDRYQGRLVRDDHVDLFNYNAADYDNTTAPVTRMEIDAFRYARDVETATPSDIHLYYAELQLTDFVDGRDAAPSLLPGPVGFDSGPFDSAPFDS